MEQVVNKFHLFFNTRKKSTIPVQVHFDTEILLCVFKT